MGSYGWLEFLADSENADFFTETIEDTENLVVATFSIYEVFKRVCQQHGEGEALRATGGHPYAAGSYYRLAGPR